MTRSRADLIAENAMLRQQFIVPAVARQFHAGDLPRPNQDSPENSSYFNGWVK
jgi:hypothetical protein